MPIPGIKTIAASAALGLLSQIPMCASPAPVQRVTVTGYVTRNGFRTNLQLTIDVHDASGTQKVVSSPYGGWSAQVRKNEVFTAKANPVPTGCSSGVATDLAFPGLVEVVPLYCS